MKLPKCKCQKCKYEWTPRKETRPKVCPECKCPKWDCYKKEGN